MAGLFLPASLLLAQDDGGGLLAVEDELGQPHHDLIDSEQQVMIYELVAHDRDGAATTVIGAMTGVTKDNRLLPRGWSADGPEAQRTAPLGVHDHDFVAGSDVVTDSVPQPKLGRPVMQARLWYQPIPPAWADALADSKTAEADTFLSYYYGADPAPELLATDTQQAP